MMGFDEFSNTGLLLGLGLTLPSNKRADLNHNHNPQKPKKPAVGASLFCFAAAETEPGLTLGLSTAAAEPAQSAVSCLTGGGRVKREREVSGEDVEEEKGSCRVSDEEEEGSNCRKKLRLTKQQSALLEDSFKLHTTLNPKEKQILARELNLRARQVEVWFQNRRARTKSKQTEVDCEFLKRCCETLTDENRRLQKELQELKALKLAHPLFMQMPAATLSICPSCERIGGGAATANGETKPNAPFKPLFYKPFTNPSAAC